MGVGVCSAPVISTGRWTPQRIEGSSLGTSLRPPKNRLALPEASEMVPEEMEKLPEGMEKLPEEMEKLPETYKHFPEASGNFFERFSQGCRKAGMRKNTIKYNV